MFWCLSFNLFKQRDVEAWLCQNCSDVQLYHFVTNIYDNTNWGMQGKLTITELMMNSCHLFIKGQFIQIYHLHLYWHNSTIHWPIYKVWINPKVWIDPQAVDQSTICGSFQSPWIIPHPMDQSTICGSVYNLRINPQSVDSSTIYESIHKLWINP